MSQLTFDNAFGEPISPESKIETPPKPPRKETWYKGRVLSHSSVSMYRTCPQKWKFRYVDKVPEAPKSFFSFGKSVHTGLEYLFSNLKEAWPVLQSVLDYYKEKWIREGYETSAQEKWFFQEGERILKGFYAKHQNDFKQVAQVEYRFEFDVEGVPMMGFIDRVDETPAGKLAIIDYKTGKAFDKSRVRKDPQLTLYQLACRTIFNKEVETVTLYHLNSLTPLTVPAHSTALEEEVVKGVVEAAKGISENKFEPKPDASGHCQWCDYVQICPAFAGKKLPQSLSSSAKFNLSEAVDRFGKLDLKVSELSVERDQLKDTLLTHLANTGDTEFNSEHFSVKLKKNADGLSDLEIKMLRENGKEGK